MRIWRVRHKFNLLENIRKVFIINEKKKNDVNDALEIQQPNTPDIKKKEAETNQTMWWNNILIIKVSRTCHSKMGSKWHALIFFCVFFSKILLYPHDPSIIKKKKPFWNYKLTPQVKSSYWKFECENNRIIILQ